MELDPILEFSRRCYKCRKRLSRIKNISRRAVSDGYLIEYNGGEFFRQAENWLSSIMASPYYECEQCFHKPMRDEELRRQQKRQEALDQRLQESHQRAKDQRDRARSNLQREHQSQREVLVSHHRPDGRGELWAGGEDLLTILSDRSSISSLSVHHLTGDQLQEILEVLENLLFHEWVAAPPPRRTLDQAQVYITELYILMLSDEDSTESTSDRLQSAVASISRLAGEASEDLLLTQALYRTLSDPPILPLQQCAAEEPSAEQAAFTAFLSALTSLLQSDVDRSSAMGLQCLRLLLSALTWQESEEAHPDSTETLLRLVQTNGWSPAAAVALLQTLSRTFVDHSSIARLLMLVQVYNLTPNWTDESGRSLLQVVDVIGSESDHQDFQETLRRKDGVSLNEALEKLKMIWRLDDSVADMIRRITSAVLKFPKRADGVVTFTRGLLQSVPLTEDLMRSCLSQLCTAVFDTKGWWPTVRQMLRWCVLVLTERNNGPLLVVGVDEDPCVLAMFVASQVFFMGNKLDVVSSRDSRLPQQMDRWSDFYQHLGVSLNSNTKGASDEEVYGADVVYGTLEDWVCEYLRLGLQVMESRSPWLRGGVIMEERCLSAASHLELSKLSDSLVFTRELLQSLLGKVQQQNLEERHRFMRTLFSVLHSHLQTNTANKISNILMKMTGVGSPLDELFTLSFFESLLLNCDSKTGTNTMSLWCLESLLACVDKFHSSNKQTKQLFGMVSDLCQKLWPPVEALNLLVALADRHHDEGCVSILKILHLIITHQVTSKWTDEKHRSLFELFGLYGAEDLICYLEEALGDEEPQSIAALVDEIRQRKDIDEQTLSKAQSVVTHVTHLVQTGEIGRRWDVLGARKRSHGTEKEDLQEILAVLCNAVHRHRAGGKWWPRATQMLSWCLLALTNTGKLLEMGTGEGKSCVIAMFAVLNVLRGQKVDVISSSPVLCQRDVEEWSRFYKFFGLTVDTNTNKTEDDERKQCYQNDVVYGTIDAFSADHLRQIFEMKDVRPDRGFQCIIIDEVDSLLLDQGVQLTYLSSPMVSMQHLNVVLAMIWAHVNQYGCLSTRHQRFVQGPPASFFKVIFDSGATETTEIQDPLHLLNIAEGFNIVPEGFTEQMSNGGKEELLKKLSTVSQDAMVDFFQKLEDYVPYGFNVYALDDSGWLSPRKCSSSSKDTPQLSFLVLGEGLCCSLYDSEDTVIQVIAEMISEKIQYTPCENSKDRISIPGFLEKLVRKKLPLWVQNAFVAKQMQQGEEYVVEDDNVFPVDFQSTGTVELNKKWGDGLQQFVEMKHQIKMSTISTVTNYMSNISFFEKYQGKIFGATGTLGIKSDILCLQKLHPNLSVTKMPTSNRKKLFEVKGSLTTSPEKWTSEIKSVVMAQTSPTAYRGGRAALVICETISKAQKIYKELEGSMKKQKILLYCRSDIDNSNTTDEEMLPGDVIVATNLAGRGTDIKVSKEVNNNGGLIVILTFLSENTRVELQAFGRTARKGKPGSAQIIVCIQHLQESVGAATCLQQAKSARDELAAEKINDMMTEVTKLKLREDLFSQYLQALHDIHSEADGDEKRAVVAIMNEFWGIWLQMKTEEIEQLKRSELQSSLEADLLWAKSQCQNQTSPCASIYHYVRFGNIAMAERRWAVAAGLFEKAMKQDESWAAVAFYSHAHCTLQQQSEDYLLRARQDLQRAQESLKYLCEESMLCMQFVKMSGAGSADAGPSSLEKQLTAKSSMLACWDKNISEAIQKLDQIKEKGGGANAQKSSIFSLVSTADEDLQEEAYNLFNQGLKYIFTVEGEPCFQWEALLLVGLGVVQIIGGVYLTVTTVGTCYAVGLELITEGIQDCIHAMVSMVKGDFSWKAWITNKAMSIGMSLLMFGVGKLIAKGFKAGKAAFGTFCKEVKALPKLFSKQAKDVSSVIMKTNLRNAFKYTAKKAVEQVVSYGLGEAEEAILRSIIASIKVEVSKRIVNDVNSTIKNEPWASLVDFVILSNLEDKEQLSDLLQNEKTKKHLLDIFTEFSEAALEPFYTDLLLQNKLHSSFSSVIQAARAEARGRTRDVLTTIQLLHAGTLVADALWAVARLSSSFFSNLQKEMKTFRNENELPEGVSVSSLAASDCQMLGKFKKELADSMSVLLADTFVEVFHQKFSSHVISHIKGKLNQYINGAVRGGLQSRETEEALQLGQHNRYLAYMPVDAVPGNNLSGEMGPLSLDHARRIMDDPTTKGTILEIRMVAELTNTEVIIQREDSQGRFETMQQVRPDSGPTNHSIKLIYRPKSNLYPDGHYDVRINNEVVRVDNEGNGCLFHALARGMNPDASETHVAQKAQRLRSSVTADLCRNPGRWEPLVQRRVWMEAMRGGDWFLAEGGAVRRVKERESILKEEVGTVGIYRDLQKYTAKKGFGLFIHADHQPPLNSILLAIDINQNSKFAAALLEVATNSSTLDSKLINNVKDKHGPGLPAVYVPAEIHHEFLSTRSKEFREHLAQKISQGEVVESLKLMFLGSMPRCELSDRNNYKDFQNKPISQTRLDVFQNSFPQHSKEMAKTWFHLLQDKGVMTHRDLTAINQWIDTRGYKDQNDPNRQEVARFLKK